MSFFGLLVLAAVAGPGGGADNPLAPALAGQLECTAPDDRKKTCRSIASYRLVEGSTYSNTALILLLPVGPMTFETTSPVTVKADAVCGMIRREDIASGKLRLSGRLLEEAEAAPILAHMTTAMSAVIGKEICTSYQPSPDGFIEKATIDGVYQAGSDQRVEWVRPDDGYTVAP